MIFVDSGAWFAVMVPSDPNHRRAMDWWVANRQPLLTTDYIVDETLTLLRARRQRERAISAGDQFFGGVLADVHHVGLDDVAHGWEIFSSFTDKDWSFTDCVSYALISRWKIQKAFAFDVHFRQFGIVEVVP